MRSPGPCSTLIAVAAVLGFLGGPRAAAATPYTYERTLLRSPITSQAEFGRSATLVGTRIAVGAHSDDLDGPDAGAVYLYDADTGAFEQVLHNPNPVGGHFFGGSLAAVGSDHVLVGSPNDDTAGGNGGAAFLFDVETGAIVRSFFNPVPPSPQGGSPATGFAQEVAAWGNIVAIAHRTASGGGVVYVHDAFSGQLVATLTNPSGTGDLFGHAIAMNQERIAVNELDKLIVHLFALDGTFQLSIPRPLPTAPSDRFGFALALTHSYLLIGDERQLANEPAGVAYVYAPATGAYIRTLTAPTPSSGDNFGVSVALRGDVAAIASFAGNGAVHLYDVPTGVLLQSVVPPDGEADDFGRSLAVGNGRMIVGSASAQAAFVFTTPCGNGALDDGEHCDDGNAVEGDCCSPQCSFESGACDDGSLCTGDDVCQAGICVGSTISCDDENPCTDDSCHPDTGCASVHNSVACDDGDLCTVGDACISGSCGAGEPLSCEPFEECDPSAGCSVVEQTGCFLPTVPKQAPLVLRHGKSNRQDVLTWSWKSGSTITTTDFGDPMSATSYRFFLFDDSVSPQPVLDVVIPAAGTCGDRRPKPCWKQTRTGYKYQRRGAGGTLRLGLRAGAAGRAGIQLQGQGQLVQLPSMPLMRPVRAQLSQTDSPTCWGALYDLFITKNEAARFRARAN